MDCAIHRISCQISKVVEAIGHPTGWEIAGVVVAAIAALGTLAIATLNVILLTKQFRLQKFADDRDRLEKRSAFGATLTNWVVASTTANLVKQDPTKVLSADEHFEILRVASASGEPSQVELVVYIETSLKLLMPPHDAVEELPGLARLLVRQIQIWVQNPQKVDFKAAEADVRKIMRA